MTSLRDWHALLRIRFADLREHRKRAGDWPIFALEHGLEVHDRALLASLIEATPGDFDRSNWLPWVVYAAEVGYSYSGREYWASFRKRFPLRVWTQADTNWLFWRFREFANTFGGARPAGEWAADYSYISWPLTHAILPLDLQRKLAGVLFRLRYSPDLFASADRLGEQISADATQRGNRRFRDFTTNTELVGQIAAALLVQSPDAVDVLLSSDTVVRILDDLEKTQEAREWLAVARSKAGSIRVDGLLRVGRTPHLAQRSTSDLLHRDTSDAARQLRATSEPELLLRPGGPQSWQLRLILPDLSAAVEKFPESRELLEKTRCLVAGSSGRPLPPGALLGYGSREVVLQELPESNAVLLQVQADVPSDFAFVLTSECCLPPGRTWLFRVDADGRGHRLSALQVRPGHRYVVVSLVGPLEGGAHAIPTEISCDGLWAIETDVPEACSEEDESYFERLGLGVARSLAVWPAGITPAAWDGEGRLEWLAGDKPVLGIRVDYPVERFRLQCCTADTVVRAPGDGPLFVRLPKLAPGRHTFRVSELNGVKSQELGNLDILVRQPRFWSALRSQLAGLRISTVPSDATLEQWRAGVVVTEMEGPAQSFVRARISFLGGDDSPILAKDLPRFAFPMGAEEWQAFVSLFCADEGNVADALDDAMGCRVEFLSEELGQASFNCCRSDRGLRWICRRDVSGYRIRLVDPDLGAESIRRYDFASPDIAAHLTVDDCATWSLVPPSGALYLAKTTHSKRTFIAPPLPAVAASNNAVPHLTSRLRDGGSVRRLLNLLDLWDAAELPDWPLAEWSQRTVRRAFMRQLCGLVVGDSWSQAESIASKLTSAPAIAKALGGSVQVLSDDQLFAELRSAGQDVSTWGPRTAVLRLGRLIERIVSPVSLPEVQKSDIKANALWLSEFALRLASEPSAAQDWAKERMATGLAALWRSPAIARAARYIVLVSERGRPGNAGVSQSLYEGWEWQ